MGKATRIVRSHSALYIPLLLIQPREDNFEIRRGSRYTADYAIKVTYFRRSRTRGVILSSREIIRCDSEIVTEPR